MKVKSKYVLANEQWERDVNKLSRWMFGIVTIIAIWFLFQ